MGGNFCNDSKIPLHGSRVDCDHFLSEDIATNRGDSGFSVPFLLGVFHCLLSKLISEI